MAIRIKSGKGGVGMTACFHKGKVTVIFRDDPYFHLNRDAKTSVAATYDIDAVVKGGQIRGKHTGTFGHAWSRRGNVAGCIGRQRSRDAPETVAPLGLPESSVRKWPGTLPSSTGFLGAFLGKSMR